MKDLTDNIAPTALPKSPRKGWTIARRVVQFFFLFLFPLPILWAGWSLFGLSMGENFRIFTPAELPFYGSLSSSLIDFQVFKLELLDPFAVLQILVASKTFALDWLIFVLPIFAFYLIIRGRVFCGWVCPANLILEFTDFLRRLFRIKIKERTIPRHAKIIVAAAVLVVSAIISIPLFEVFSPISAVNKSILFGSTAGILTLVAIIITELFWSHRVWCRALCPLGGFYQLIGRVGLFNVRIEQAECIHCDRCKEKCLADPVILDPALEDKSKAVLAGDCMLCGACVDVCPTKALKIRPGLDHFKPVK
jgi:ferredoxin-type protein NapH